MSSVSKENNTQPLGQGSEEFLWGFTLQTARYSNHPLPRHSYSPNSCHQPPLVTALLLPEPGALVCRSGPSAGVAGAPGVAQVWSLTSWCPLSKDDLPPPRQNLASHTWRSVLPVLRRRTNVSQLGSEISGRPQHWAGVTVPCTGVLTHSFWNTCNKFSLSTEAVVLKLISCHRDDSSVL